jgi:hypothetical protein
VTIFERAEQNFTATDREPMLGDDELIFKKKTTLVSFEAKDEEEFFTKMIRKAMEDGIRIKLDLDDKERDDRNKRDTKR